MRYYKGDWGATFQEKGSDESKDFLARFCEKSELLRIRENGFAQYFVGLLDDLHGNKAWRTLNGEVYPVERLFPKEDPSEKKEKKALLSLWRKAGAWGESKEEKEEKWRDFFASFFADPRQGTTLD